MILNLDATKTEEKGKRYSKIDIKLLEEYE